MLRRLALSLKEDWAGIFVAEASDQIVGFFDFAPGTNEIRHIYVDPDHHRRGIGRLMMEAALNILRDQGFETAAIDLVEGTGASEFHRVMGWREKRRRKDGEGVSVISMFKDL